MLNLENGKFCFKIVLNTDRIGGSKLSKSLKDEHQLSLIWKHYLETCSQYMFHVLQYIVINGLTSAHPPVSLLPSYSFDAVLNTF